MPYRIIGRKHTYPSVWLIISRYNNMNLRFFFFFTFGSFSLVVPAHPHILPHFPPCSKKACLTYLHTITTQFLPGHTYHSYFFFSIVFITICHTTYSTSYVLGICSSTLEWKFHEERALYLFCSLLYPQFT